jgi:streptogramin lyase
LTADPSGDVWVANCYPPNAGPGDDVVRLDARTLDFKQTRPLPGGAGYYRALAYGGGSLWASEIVGAELPNESTVTQIDPDTGAERTIDVIPTAGGLAWSGAYGDLWIAHYESGSLTRLNAATGAMKTLYDVGGNPALPIVDGDVVWVADWAAPRVVRLHTAGRPRAHEILLPVKNFAAVAWAVAAGAGAVWATTPRDGALWRIDPNTNAVRRIHMPFLPSGVTADDDAVWVTVRKP